MMKQLAILLRILLDRRITSVPVKVFRELKTQGISRLPDHLDKRIDRGFPLVAFFQLLREWLEGEQFSRHNKQWILNSFFPPMPSPAFDKLFENLLHRKRRFSPVSIFCAVTGKCPYSCWHCSAAGKSTEDLGTEDWYKIIDDLHQVNGGIIGFTGGEPLVRSDLAQLIKRAVHGGAHTIVFTSGYGLNEQKAEELKEAGLSSICVSLDSVHRESHDKMRGNGTAYERAIEAIRISKGLGFYSMIGAVTTRSFIENEDYITLYELGKTLSIDEIRLVEPKLCGKLGKDHEEHVLTADHIQKIRGFHKTMNKKGKLPRVCAFNQIESPELLGCTAGIQHMYINSNGEVSPCDFVPLGFGNAAKESFEDILIRMNDAMGMPRAHCIIQRNYELINAYADHGFPLPKELSLKLSKELQPDELPGYYKMVMRNQRQNLG